MAVGIEGVVAVVELGFVVVVIEVVGAVVVVAGA